jgi:citrate lyase subunit beta / citryl-CoA lyase
MRSLLFVPADSEKKLAKALHCGADALILDLEDSVAFDRKAAARPMAAAFLREALSKPDRPRLYVRINAHDTPFWQDDIAGVLAAKPDGLMQPKPRSARDVDALAAHLDSAEAALGLKPGHTKIIAIATEVPASVLTMHTYLDATPRLEGITWGAEDLSALVGSSATRQSDGYSWTSPYRLARDMVLMAATATNRQPIDTVFANFRNLDGFKSECIEAVRDGFTAKMAIHPDQVPLINATFTPSASEIAWAKEITALFAVNPGAGALSLRGQMIDRPHLVRATRILARI